MIFWDLSATNDSRFQCYKGHMERFQPGNPSTIFFGRFGFSSVSSWWFQPSWKISVKIGNLPQIGMKIKNIWVATTQVSSVFYWRWFFLLFWLGMDQLFGFKFFGFGKKNSNESMNVLQLRNFCASQRLEIIFFYKYMFNICFFTSCCWCFPFVVHFDETISLLTIYIYM